jgi:hypothetical protein
MCNFFHAEEWKRKWTFCIVLRAVTVTSFSLLQRCVTVTERIAAIFYNTTSACTGSRTLKRTWEIREKSTTRHEYQPLKVHIANLLPQKVLIWADLGTDRKSNDIVQPKKNHHIFSVLEFFFFIKVHNHIL